MSDMSDTADIYTAALVMQNLADNTIRIYRALYVRWRDWAIQHNRDPDRPDPLAVRAWSRTLAGSRSVLAQARAAIGHACRIFDTPDVSDAIPLPRQPRRPRGRVLDAEDGARLAQKALNHGTAGLAVLVGLFTAARRSEIAGLAWRDVDFDRATITFTRPKTRDRHTVPLHPNLADQLIRRKVPGETWVFPGRWGGHVSPATIGTWVERVAEDADLGHVTPHVLRRTAGTHANDRTRDLRAVQDLLGHTDPSVTAGYTRVTDAALSEAVGALDWLDAV